MSASTKDTHMSNPLYKLPPELRYQIFKPLLIHWNGNMSNLIEALRPEEKLYHEALEIFYKENIFVFHRENGWSFRDMTKRAVLTIEKARIEIE